MRPAFALSLALLPLPVAGQDLAPDAAAALSCDFAQVCGNESGCAPFDLAVDLRRRDEDGDGGGEPGGAAYDLISGEVESEAFRLPRAELAPAEPRGDDEGAGPGDGDAAGGLALVTPDLGGTVWLVTVAGGGEALLSIHRSGPDRARYLSFSGRCEVAP